MMCTAATLINNNVVYEIIDYRFDLTLYPSNASFLASGVFCMQIFAVRMDI